MRRASIGCTRQLDRYIPRRHGSNIDLSHIRLCNLSRSTSNLDSDGPDWDDCMASSPLGSPLPQSPGLSEHGSMLNISTGSDVFEQNHFFPSHNKTPKRQLPSSPERRLDMPNMNDDIYANTFSWGSNGDIAVALKDDVYIWEPQTNKKRVVTMDTTESTGTAQITVTSLAWNNDGTVLLLGTEDGLILLQQVHNNEGDCMICIGNLKTSDLLSQVDTMLWTTRGNHPALFASYACGRVAAINLKRLDKAFAQPGGAGVVEVIRSNSLVLPVKMRVCGLQASPKEHYLAISGTDGNIYICDLAQKTFPLQLTIKAHTGIICALSFCPWQPTFIASGGGMVEDGKIKGHKATNGTKVFEIETHSQICSLVWCEPTRELISGHGNDHGGRQIRIWSYPAMDPVGSLSGDGGGIVCLDISPDSCTLASLSESQSLFLWVIAKKKPLPRRRQSSLQLFSPITASPLAACIR